MAPIVTKKQGLDSEIDKSLRYMKLLIQMQWLKLKECETIIAQVYDALIIAWPLQVLKRKVLYYFDRKQIKSLEDMKWAIWIKWMQWVIKMVEVDNALIIAGARK